MPAFALISFPFWQFSIYLFMFYYLFKIFIVIQLQLYDFSPHNNLIFSVINVNFHQSEMLIMNSRTEG